MATKDDFERSAGIVQGFALVAVVVVTLFGLSYLVVDEVFK